ncbi:MAG: YfhO family protein [Bacteroidota bacterium]|nr:YfhO family protein [Bacteroidota bacterium]
MKSINWKKILPHVIAVAVFVIIAAIFCRPSLEGKVLYQHDIMQYDAASKDIADYAAKHGKAPLWTNNMFSGMPTYQIWMPANNVLPTYVNKVLTLGLPQPMQFFFLACILFYFLSQVARVNPYIGVLGSLAFGYSTYNIGMITAGHVTQMWCVAYMPAMLGSLMLIYRKKYLIGTAMLALFTATQIGLNHLQVTYYLFFILAFYTIACIIQWIKNKEYGHLIKSLALTAVAALTGVMVNAVSLLTTYEYSKDTIRGGSLSLKDTTAASSTGLTKDYAFSYSYKPMETFTVMFPRIYGGSDGNREIGEDSKVNQALADAPQQIAQQLNGIQNGYWGGLPYTAGPPYYGVITCFLFIVFLFFIPGATKWWIVAISAFAILLSWGKSFSAFNYFIFDHLPLYNKFRAPSMSLVIPQLLWPFAAILALQQVIVQRENPDTWKKLKKAGITAAAVIVIMLMAYLSFSYLDDGSKQLKEQMATQNAQVSGPVLNVVKSLTEDRKNIFLQDILKAIAIAGVFFVVLALYARNKIKKETWLLAAAIILVLIDLLPVDSLYLNKQANGEDAWSEGDETTSKERIMGKADEQILKDTGWYRVLDLSGGSPFADASASYFHHSIGGYHAAKIGRYQDLIENKLTGELRLLYNDSTIGTGLNQSRYTGLNMLNTKYIIFPGANANQPPGIQVNLNALGPCWFVHQVRFAANLKDEMNALNGLDASQTAIVPAGDQSKITQPVYDSSAKIEKVRNGDDHNMVTYKSSATTTQFAVFSEVYYSEGWNAYIDGKKTDYVKTDYTLRGMNVPAGNHTIEFKFEPSSFERGKLITSIGQILVLLLLAAGIFFEIRDSKKTV